MLCFILGEWLTGRNNQNNKVRVVATGFGDTRQTNLIEDPLISSSQLKQAMLDIDDNTQ